MDKLINLYTKYFSVTPFCDGLYLSLKCLATHKVTEVKPSKLRFYKDAPHALCSYCCSASLETYKKIRTMAKKTMFALNTDRATFLEQKNAELTCPKGHSVTTSVPLKYCPKCIDLMDHFFVGKKINKKYQKPSVQLVKDTYYLLVPSTKQQYFKDAFECLKTLKTNTNILKKFHLLRSAFKRINLGKICGDICDLTDLSENVAEINFRNFRLEEENNSSTNTEPQEQDKLEEPKVEEVVEEPKEKDPEIATELADTEIVQFMKDHDRMMEQNYHNVQKIHSISYEENDQSNNVGFENSAQKEQNKSAGIIGDISKVICDTTGQHVREKNIDHLKKYVKPVGKMATPFYSIRNKKIKAVCVLDRFRKEDGKIDFTGMEELKTVQEIVYSEEDRVLFKKLIKALFKLRDLIQTFHDNPKERQKLNANIKSAVKVIKDLHDEEFTVVSVGIVELLSVINPDKNLYIDPVIINTIILARNNSNLSPFSSYYYGLQGDDHFLLTDKENNMYWRFEGKYYWLTRYAAQKALYIDSGVAKLFVQLVLSQMRLVDAPIESLLNKENDFLSMYPMTMFDTSENHLLKCSRTKEQIKEIHGMIDFTYDFAEFLLSVFSDERKSYLQRFKMVRSVMIFMPTGWGSWIKHIEPFFQENYRKFLSEDEEDTLVSTWSAQCVQREIIRSEVSNIFAKQISDPSKAELLGTILFPRT